jgi:DNA-binding LacI/PurR family transcriptional regulator
MGVRVPRDLSVLSFDDSTLTEMTHPAVTSMARDTDNLGALTATELLRVIAEPGVVRHVQSALLELVVRGSTEPPAEAD